MSNAVGAVAASAILLGVLGFGYVTIPPLALGYVHARFRLSQPDAERRLGEGRLAQLGGPSDLASDQSSRAWACCARRRTSGRTARARPARR